MDIDCELLTILAARSLCWLNRVSDHLCEARGVDRKEFVRGTRPTVHVGRGINEQIRSRNNSAFGQLAANANFTRVPVSRTRTATFNRRSRMVENSPLARGSCFGMASRTTRTSQKAAVCKINRI